MGRIHHKFHLNEINMSSVGHFPQQGYLRDFHSLQAIFDITNTVSNRLFFGTFAQVFIQGPYGTPSTSTFTADHAVLIGGGIGVTPYAAIVQSIMCQYRRYQQKCPNCHHRWTRDLPQDVLKVKKVGKVRE